MSTPNQHLAAPANGVTPAPRAGTESGAIPASSCRRVLILARDGAATAPLAEYLLQAGFQIVLEADPVAALQHCADHRVDFVLADIAMAPMRAAEFCRQYRALSRDHYGYLLLVSLRWNAALATECLNAGGDDCIVLPVDREQFLARILAGERVLKMEERLISANRRLHGALAELRRVYNAMEGDMREARKLQLGLVPRREVEIDGMALSLLLRPAGHIGGDLVGYRLLAPGRLAFYAIDVAGHGVTAALMTARLFAWLNGSDLLLAAESGGPADVVASLNDLMLQEISADTYFTMIYGELCTSTGALRLVQAGHPHPVLQTADGAITTIGQGGMPVGVFERADYDEVALNLASGDRLFIASDGITEARAPGGMLLGEEGLRAVLQMNAQLRGPILLESLCWSVSEFSGGERSDDISALVIEHLTEDARNHPLGEEDI